MDYYEFLEELEHKVAYDEFSESYTLEHPDVTDPLEFIQRFIDGVD